MIFFGKARKLTSNKVAVGAGDFSGMQMMLRRSTLYRAVEWYISNSDMQYKRLSVQALGKKLISRLLRALITSHRQDRFLFTLPWWGERRAAIMHARSHRRRRLSAVVENSRPGIKRWDEPSRFKHPKVHVWTVTNRLSLSTRHFVGALLSDAYWNFRYERKSLWHEKDVLFFSRTRIFVSDIGIARARAGRLRIANER